MTRHISYAEFCKNLSKYMDEVSGSRASLHIERETGSVVIMSEEEFEGWKETIYLLQNPTNADELLKAVKAADAGTLEEHDLMGER
jgi:antitoxin YefM